MVRAYADLLADEPPLEGRESEDPARREQRNSWHLGTIEQVERLDRLVDSILASVRVEPDQAATLATVDIEEFVRGSWPTCSRCSIGTSPSSCPAARFTWWSTAPTCERSWSTSSRTP